MIYVKRERERERRIMKRIIDWDTCLDLLLKFFVRFLFYKIFKICIYFKVIVI